MTDHEHLSTQGIEPGGEPRPADAPNPVPSPPAEQPTAQTQRSTGKEGNAEAARYRRALRETEAERDTLNTRVESLQRAAAEQFMTGKLDVPADLWRFGIELADVLDDDGTVSPVKVTAAWETVLESRPMLRSKRMAGLPPVESLRPAGSSGAANRPQWKDAFNIKPTS